ncbi:MAG: sigma-70 family RNA polymerase sigma factor [Phycisphaerae bacterium]|nr:sigma-70 family RNA polymerase sigma factor [Phycisphaerae bacterium]
MSADLTHLDADELARLARAGSSASFAILVDRYVARLQRYLRHRVRSEHDAEDLTQETLLRAFAAIGRYVPGRSFSAWLFTIATRLAIDHARRRKPDTDVAGLELGDRRTRQPIDDVADGERDGAVWRVARDTLSDDQFAAMWLHYAEALPVRHVAAAMGKTRIHVRVLLHRGRARLLRTRLAAFSDTAADTLIKRPSVAGAQV